MDYIKDFVIEYYPWVLAALAGGTSFLFPITKQIWVIILRAFLTKKALIRVFIHVGDYVVAQTKTDIDNELWAEAKKALVKELMK
jgi:hypothetical protein